MIGFRSSLAMSAALLVGIGIGFTSIASAQESTQNYRIEAGDLGSALNAFAAQSRLQILYSPGLVAGKATRGLSGNYTPQQALTRLLRGTGLRADAINTGTFVLKVEGKSDSKNPVPPSPASASGPPPSPPMELEAVQVVGTLIRDVPPTSPVITIGREDIERGGYTSTQDIFEKLPQNFSGMTTSTGMQTGYYTTNQIDLRGLGPESTLTLVNGRRVSRAAGNEGRAVDISMIPVSAIERVDILTDGASALYGSDAVAGVVNIVLRDDFEGAETSVQYGHKSSGASTKLLSQIVGTHWDGGHLLAMAQYQHTDATHYRDLGVTSADLRLKGGGDFRFVGAGSPGTVYPLGYFAGAPFSTISGRGGAPVFWAKLPDTDGRHLSIDDLSLGQQTTMDFVPRDMSPKQENSSIYLTFEQNMGSVTIFADVLGSRRKTYLTSIAPVGYLIVPPSNAFSPFEEPVLVGYQMKEFGFPSKWTNTGWFTNLGARGQLGIRDWTWQVVGNISRDVSLGRRTGYDTNALVARLASPDPTQAFNPFGNATGQSPGVVEDLLRQRNSESRTSAREVTAKAQGSLADLPGGALRAAFGAEFRHEGLESTRGGDGLATETQFVESTQSAKAVFGEVYVPLVGPTNARPSIRELALSAAVRYEHYNDFGDTTNPKIGVLYRPSDDLTLKANWGTSFRAPSLRELYYPASVNDTASIFDPRAPGGAKNVFMRLALGGNPNLKPEKAGTFTLGGTYRPEWAKGLHLSVDYYRIDYKSRITGAGDGLTQELLLQYEETLPAGIVERDANGNLVQISTAYVNSARTRISGWDLATGYDWVTAGRSYLSLSGSATVTARYDNQIVPGAPRLAQVGIVGAPPKWRGRLGMSWSRHDWGASMTVNYIDGAKLVEQDPRILRREVDSQTTVDMQLSYSARGDRFAWLHGLTLRFGVDNIFDVASPFVDGPFNFGIGAQNFIIGGRSTYLRVTKAFGGPAQ